MGAFDYLGRVTGLGDVVSAGIDYYSGRGARRAARDAAEAEAEATRKAQEYTDQGYNEAYNLQKPYLEMGNTALNDLYNRLNSGYYDSAQPVNTDINALTKQFMQTDPGMQFRMDQSRKQQEASAAARGNLLSSGEAKRLQENSQNLASQEYGNMFSRAFGQAQSQAAQNNNFYDQARQKLADHFQRIQGLANLAPTTATNLANNKIGRAGANAGFAQDYGNIQAAKYNAVNDANSQAFSNAANLGMNILGYKYGNPSAQPGAVSNIATQGATSSGSWTPQPLTTNGDYSHVGTALVDRLKQGYL